MSIECNCPNPSCRKKYALASGVAGKTVKCKACGETFVANASKTQADDYIEPAWSNTVKPPTVSGTGAPTTIGRFAIRGKLGSGAFGTVYRAYDVQLDREVALKVPNAGVTTDAKRVERFLREAKAAAKLQHPHIVPVFDAGKDGDSYYIASAFIDGEPLADSIDEKGTDFARAARLVRELAEALAYAHGQGVVHRDVKPANMMLGAGDHIHLMDFGLASLEEEGAQLTSDGAIMGTPAYMSPEQARGQKGDAQPATDQYSAGVVLYKLLTGRTPFGGPPAVVIAAVLSTDPDPPRKLRPGVPKDLETICLKAMSKDPGARYSDCQAMADDLRRWLEDEPITARRMSVRERAARWVKREPKLAGAMAAIALVLFLSVLVVTDAARKADAAAEQSQRDALDARAAERRAEGALKDARSAREREELAAGATLGALGTAAEERKRFLAEREKAEAEQKQAAALRDQIAQERKDAGRVSAELIAARDELRKAQARLLEERARAAKQDGKLSAIETWSVQIAHKLYREDGAAAAALLQDVREERRGWEWRHVSRLCSGPVQSVVSRRAHDGPAEVAAFSGDGSRVATYRSGDGVRVWDTKTGQEVTKFKSGPLLAFSPDGKRLITQNEIVDAAKGTPLAELKGLAVAICNNGSFVLTTDNNARDLKAKPPARAPTAAIVSAKTGQVIQSLVAVERIEAADVTEDATRVVTLHADGTIQVWDAIIGKKLAQMKTAVAPRAGTAPRIAFSPNGKLIASVRERAVEVWNADEGKRLHAFTGSCWPSPQPLFSSDGMRLFVADERGRSLTGAPVGIDVATGQSGGALPVGACVAISPDGTRIVVGAHKVARVVSATTGDVLLTFNYSQLVYAAVWSPDGNKLLVGLNDGTVEIRDAGPPPPAGKP